MKKRTTILGGFFTGSSLYSALKLQAKEDEDFKAAFLASQNKIAKLIEKHRKKKKGIKS